MNCPVNALDTQDTTNLGRSLVRGVAMSWKKRSEKKERAEAHQRTKESEGVIHRGSIKASLVVSLPHLVSPRLLHGSEV